MKFVKCKNKPRKECCNDCKEPEYCCYIFNDTVKVKNYIKHLGDHSGNPDKYIQINIIINIFLSLGLEMEDADYASILIDRDSPLLEISSQSMFINIVSAKQVPFDIKI